MVADIVFEQSRQHARNREPRAVQRMHERGLSAGRLEAYVGAARLEVREAGAARYFEPPLLPRRPHFEIELLGVRETDVARAYREHAVWQIQLLQNPLGVVAELFELLETAVGVRPFDELHFVELVQAVENPRLYLRVQLGSM